ncbi:Peptidylprolyl isomerase [Quillaja saponaria]|uniref:peptidylprolyl isomerase n=1 Tax=Quillaja saponaria TaxID=32244 RepID=A0AAD7PCU1_QUISA|nr:Peptidylprolyl isomerase [Quillaja saponaria]
MTKRKRERVEFTRLLANPLDNIQGNKKRPFYASGEAMLTISTTISLPPKPSHTISTCTGGTFFAQTKQIAHGCSNHKQKDDQAPDRYKLHSDEILRRKYMLSVLVSTAMFPTLSSYGKTKSKSPYDEKRLLEQNRRRQKENNAPEDFPNFVREGFEVNVVTSGNYIKCDSGLIYRDFEVGKGDCPKAGQQVTFHYVGYNESGRRIDSTYLQGTPAKIRIGNNALVPGFEEGIQDMRPGGKRRIIIPPELGPPVGPSTFFSAKQFEVFDVELLSIQNCQRRTIAFYSDVVCN